MSYVIILTFVIIELISHNKLIIFTFLCDNFDFSNNYVFKVIFQTLSYF